MADVHDKKTRSYNMSQIKGSDTKSEMIVRKYLHGKGLRFRLHDKFLPGKPDLVFKKYKTVVFINGCFWHGHEDCKYFTILKTRTDWWKDKIFKTKERNQLIVEKLEATGWKVIVVWECKLKSKNQSKSLEKLHRKIIAT
ncbi:very short patch repair endonuclease [Leeuwenhoekiella sp. MAR_2009_132]|uniref:very short patch repair endonuclease n=1 Tax=Leeuwenhoekiella sp. MAR_2009_132 TaxID=1392489 RepID=UPI00049127A2|nr:DNA mismatch endonuclease Vsr [Leeuwenhoekiella sp. MAR_2009_132]